MSGLYATGALLIGAAVYTKTNPYSAKTVKGSIGINSPLAPSAPPVMPDLATQTQAQTLQESKAAALRYGRASTVLTSTGGAPGTGSDQLGP